MAQTIRRILSNTLFAKVSPVNIQLRIFEPCIFRAMCSESKKDLGYIPDLHEPSYLKQLKPQVGFYDLLDLEIKGYDYVALERYQSYLHKTMIKMGFIITKAWSSPHQDLIVETFKERSAAKDTSYTIKIYERNLQIKEATVTKLPILIEVINSTMPPGVSFHLNRHTKANEDKLYYKDSVLEKLKEDLQELKDTPLIGVNV